MTTVAAGLLSSYGAWRTFQWFLPQPTAPKLERLDAQQWIRQTDILVMLFTLQFFTRKNGKKPVVQKLEEQRKKVEELVEKLRTILEWKNDGWHYAYRSLYWTGEGKVFKELKEEHAILIQRMALLKQLEK